MLFLNVLEIFLIRLEIIGLCNGVGNRILDFHRLQEIVIGWKKGLGL